LGNSLRNKASRPDPRLAARGPPSSLIRIKSPGTKSGYIGIPEG
jgi:hypothetical protein